MPPLKQHAMLKLDKGRGTMPMLETLAENMVGQRAMYKSLACHCAVEYAIANQEQFIRWWREQQHLQSDRGENGGIMQYNRRRAANARSEER